MRTKDLRYEYSETPLTFILSNLCSGWIITVIGFTVFDYSDTQKNWGILGLLAIYMFLVSLYEITTFTTSRIIKKRSEKDRSVDELGITIAQFVLFVGLSGSLILLQTAPLVKSQYYNWIYGIIGGLLFLLSSFFSMKKKQELTKRTNSDIDMMTQLS